MCTTLNNLHATSYPGCNLSIFTHACTFKRMAARNMVICGLMCRTNRTVVLLEQAFTKGGKDGICVSPSGSSPAWTDVCMPVVTSTMTKPGASWDDAARS